MKGLGCRVVLMVLIVASWSLPWLVGPAGWGIAGAATAVLGAPLLMAWLLLWGQKGDRKFEKLAVRAPATLVRATSRQQGSSRSSRHAPLYELVLDVALDPGAPERMEQLVRVSPQHVHRLQPGERFVVRLVPGTPRTLKVDFEADPEETDDDVIARLLETGEQGVLRLQSVRRLDETSSGGCLSMGLLQKDFTSIYVPRIDGAGHPVFEATFVLLVEGREVGPLKSQIPIPRSCSHRMIEGADLPIRFNPTNPSEMAIDWR